MYFKVPLDYPVITAHRLRADDDSLSVCPQAPLHTGVSKLDPKKQQAAVAVLDWTIIKKPNICMGLGSTTKVMQVSL